MPKPLSELEQQYADLKAAETGRRVTRKRARTEQDGEDENADPQNDIRRLRAENARLRAEITTIQARLADAERARQDHGAEHDDPAPQANVGLADRVSNQDAQLLAQGVQITTQAAEIAALQQMVNRFIDNRPAASGSLQPAANPPAINPPSVPQPSRDDLTPGKEQYRDILSNGSKPERLRSLKEPIYVARPADLRKFVRNGGLPNEGGNEYMIPPGVITEPHRDLLPVGQPGSRPSTPVEDPPRASVNYNDKVYYHIAASNVKDADKLGLKFERKEGSDWENVAAFEKDRGLWYCDNINIDRNTLSRFTQRNIENGDYLNPGVQPSNASQVLMSHRERSSRDSR